MQRTKPANFHIPPRRTPPRWVSRAGTEAIETIFEFDTAFGPGHGIVRLVRDGEALRAWTLDTNLHELRGHEEEFKRRPPPDATRDFGDDNWLDRRNAAATYADHDPTVIVVGGGQAGLSIAARLQQLGIDTLIIDRHQRVGDNWRKRYHSLTLHNEVHVNHLPYLPFPPTFPVFIPKDKLANWCESYVESLELNFWTGTTLAGGSYDAAAPAMECHAAPRRRQQPHHASAPSRLRHRREQHSRRRPICPGSPRLPARWRIPATSRTRGYGTAATPWCWEPAPAATTWRRNCTRTAPTSHMIQRSKTYIVSLHEAQSVYAIYSEGIPFEDCDLLATSMPYPVLRRSYQLSTAASRRVDKVLLDGLAARGFRLWDGEDATGFQMMYLRRGGGYYFNVGCSDLIVSGAIGLLQFADIESFVAEGVLLRDGRVVPADLLVLATGYKNQQETVRACLGNDIAERIGPVWGLDEAANCATCGGVPRSPASGSPPGAWRNAGFSRAIWQSRSRHWSKACCASFAAATGAIPTAAHSSQRRW